MFGEEHPKNQHPIFEQNIFSKNQDISENTEWKTVKDRIKNVNSFKLMKARMFTIDIFYCYQEIF